MNFNKLINSIALIFSYILTFLGMIVSTTRLSFKKFKDYKFLESIFTNFRKFKHKTKIIYNDEIKEVNKNLLEQSINLTKKEIIGLKQDIQTKYTQTNNLD